MRLAGLSLLIALGGCRAHDPPLVDSTSTGGTGARAAGDTGVTPHARGGMGGASIATPGGSGSSVSEISDGGQPDGSGADPGSDVDVDAPGDIDEPAEAVLGSPSRLMPELPLAPSADGRFVYNPHHSRANRYRGSGHTHAAPDHSGKDPTQQEQRLRDLPGDHAHQFIWMTAHNIVVQDPGVSSITHLFGTEIYTKKMPSGAAPHVLAFLPDASLAGKSTPFGLYQYTLTDLPAVIDQAGGLAVFAHPSRYSPTIAEAVAVGDSLWGMGVVSGGTNPADNLPYLDARLSAGKYTCLSAGNDLHDANYGLTSGYQLVSADDVDRSTLFEEVKACNFFACRTDSSSVTPITSPSVVVVDGTIEASMDQAGSIRFVGQDGQQLGQTSAAKIGQYTPGAGDTYVRVEMSLPQGGARCYSQPLWLLD